MAFKLNHVCDGVTHIRDCMGVCMTLIEGEREALLVDTGYGVEDVSACVRELIGNKPVHVLLTHHHHDHALGVRSMYKIPDCRIMMLQADAPAWEKYTGIAKRRVVLMQALSKGLAVKENDFLAGVLEQPENVYPGDIALGGMTAHIIECPGHTPGSAAVLIPERRILLTGDCWNPCTWVFFPEALGVRVYRDHVRMLQAYDFDHVLCSHQLDLYPRSRFDVFVEHLTDDVLRHAKKVTIGGNENIDTRQADMTDGQILVFDWAKADMD